jgi:hypothetical protein
MDDEPGWCIGPGIGELVVEAECELVPLLEGCGRTGSSVD